MPPSDRNTRSVCLIGAGFISHLHAEALLALPGIDLRAVVDPRQDAAKAVAGRWGIPAVHESLDEALESGDIDCAHVLTPPDLHAPIATQALAKGLSVLVEKPLTPAKASSAALAAMAEEKGLVLGVNQNFLFHPAFAQMKAILESGALGRLKNLTCHYRMPLRQLQGRQFGHWMFQAPQNLLLEQAVHPLSQIRALVPGAAIAAVAVGDRLTLGEDRDLLLEADVGLRAPDAGMQFHFALGADFPHWELTASCTDGIIHADIVNNRCHTRRRTRWLEPTDQLLSGFRSAFELGSGAVGNALGYGLSMVKLKARSDAYYLSMKGAISDFHQALDQKRKPLSDARFATDLVGLCAQIAEAGGARVHTVPSMKPTPAAAPAEHDLLLIGGTGFIGRAVLAALSEKNLKIAVLARNITNLPPAFAKPNISLIRGSFTDPDAISRAMTGCRQVVHLAHGMGSGGDLIETMRAGTRLIAEQCLAHKVERLIYISSIAALYLGDADEVINADTPPDPKSEERAEYARAKALCDQDLLTLHREQNLPVVLLRPGLVVGEGTTPFHGGIGFYNNEQHCMGWSDGHHPLPFVLVEDVADAIVGALKAEAVLGKAYNIVGDVRPDAKHYIEDLADALGRPLSYHGQTVNRLYAVEWAKWILKRLGGRKVPPPSKRDLRSRGLYARFDMSIEKRDLAWQPNADEARFKALVFDAFSTDAPSDVIPFTAKPGGTDHDGDDRQQGIAGSG